jgi:CRP-like cAMP-binding protein
MLARRHEPPELQAIGSRGDHLRAVELFADVKEQPGAIERIEAEIKTRSYAPGEAIITEGEAGSELFILISGKASVFKSTVEGDQYRVVILKAEQRPFFGEGGLLDNDARSATIRAEDACVCLVLDRAGFERFSREHPQWAMPVLLRIARAVMARLRKSNNDLMLLYNALVAEIRG